MYTTLFTLTKTIYDLAYLNPGPYGALGIRKSLAVSVLLVCPAVALTK